MELKKTCEKEYLHIINKLEEPLKLDLDFFYHMIQIIQKCDGYNALHSIRMMFMDEDSKESYHKIVDRIGQPDSHDVRVIMYRLLVNHQRIRSKLISNLSYTTQATYYYNRCMNKFGFRDAE